MPHGELRDRPKELLNKLPTLYRKADASGVTLSQFLEDQDPSHEWADEDRHIRAFGRVIQASGFRFKSEPSEGIWADTIETIFSDDIGRALVPEWGRSVWRRARSSGYAPQVGPVVEHRVLGSDDFAVNTMFRPYIDAAGVYNVELTPGLGLDDLVAFTTSIAGDTYRRAYMIDPAADSVRLRRIGEKADIPRAQIDLTSHVVRLYKYGRGIEMSYEAVRRVPIDKVGLFIAQAALQVEADRVMQAIDVLLNGDGGGGSAATNYNQSALDTGTVPTVKGFIAFKSKFRPPYQMNLIIGREAELVNLQMLQMPNQNPFLAQVQGGLGFGSLTPLQDVNGGTVWYAQSDGVASGVYLGVDTRYALERITEVGSDIQETTSFVERQTNALFFTENDGFALQDANANKTWTMA